MVAAGEQVALALLDAVLHLPARIVDVLVESLAVDLLASERGGPGLDPG
jgi:hypothetical protein